MHGSMEWKESDELLQQAAKLTVIFDGVVRDFCDRHMVSGECAWQLIQGLSDIRLEDIRNESTSE